MSITPATVDVVQNGDNGFTGSGTVAMKLLQSNFNVNSLRTMDVLRKDEWKLFDDKIIEVASKRLVGVADLLERGLTLPIANALGTTQIEWEQASDLTDAEVSMGGITEAQRDRVTFALKSVPLPIIHKDFQINVRALEASRNVGAPLDTTQAAIAARIVSEKVESLLFSGSVVAGTNNRIFGYTTHADRITGSVTASWVTATGEQIVADVLAMLAAAAAAFQYGPFVIYVPIAVYTQMGDDYKAGSDKTVMDRVLQIPGIEAIRPTTDLTISNIVMVQMTSDTVDIVDGLQPTIVQWESHGGMMLNFKVMAIMAPRIKSDKEGQSGVIHYS